MARNSIQSSLPSVFLVFLSIFSLKAASFSFDLVHKDLLHNSSDTLERIRATLQRSNHSVKLLQHRRHPPQPLIQLELEADIIYDGQTFVLKFFVGTPPVETAATIDTASEYTWIQCRPCIQCFKQDYFPIFNPRKSSSYKLVRCESISCRSFENILTFCRVNCGYKWPHYFDGTYTEGDLITETLTLGTTKITNYVMGCGHINRGRFGPMSCGMVGLNAGRKSLISQLGPSIQHKFSYCLSDHGKGKIRFGKDAFVAGPDVVSTPLIVKYDKYFLTLEAVSVNTQTFRYDTNGWAGRGNILLDSATTITYLPDGLYNEMRRVMKSLLKVPVKNDPTGDIDLCFETRAGVTVEVPSVIMHFEGGADVVLQPKHMVIKSTEDTMCLAFNPESKASGSIFGYTQQEGFLIGYDLKQKTVSFKYTDCAGE